VVTGVFAVVVFGGLAWTTPLVVVPVMVAAVWALGLTWVVAGAGAYVRDLAPVVATGTLVVMFLSCVFYPVERVPQAWRWAMEWNPAAVVLESVRAAMLGVGEFRVGVLAALLAAGVVVCCAGHAWFTRVKGGFADVL
jgi:lipopolysaccharide transport system permease protein